MGGKGARGAIKSRLAQLERRAGAPADGLTTLIYHRVGGGTPDERDCATADFAAQCRVLARHRVVSLDQALAELADGDDRPKVVLTFDDGFADVESTALPLLREHGLPFTLYVATGYIGGEMHWDGSTAKASGAALSWAQLETLAADSLCTIGNHTHLCTFGNHTHLCTIGNHTHKDGPVMAAAQQHPVPDVGPSAVAVPDDVVDVTPPRGPSTVAPLSRWETAALVAQVNGPSLGDVPDPRLPPHIKHHRRATQDRSHDAGITAQPADEIG
ncbi:hypothetical protein BH23ACT9_BH23ACT9_10990 [soil metagenome]